ncbi:hypothetical protein D3C81_1356650 [compost metagenome]
MRDIIPKRNSNHVPTFQQDLARYLSIVFDEGYIKTEWSASIDSEEVYSPRLDLAVVICIQI